MWALSRESRTQALVFRNFCDQVIEKSAKYAPLEKKIRRLVRMMSNYENRNIELCETSLVILRIDLAGAAVDEYQTGGRFSI